MSDKSDKKKIYEIYKDGKKRYDVYVDGSAREYSSYNDPYFDYLHKSGLSDALETPELTFIKCNYYFNVEYSDAFIAVCLLTDSDPEKFEADGYRVEYFGEGEPWKRTLDEYAVI